MYPMDKKLPISEIFSSIQGEGKFQGEPVTFVRVSGCTRKCDFCDTKYHEKKENFSTEQIVGELNKLNNDIVVWTGGEPLLYTLGIWKVIRKTPQLVHHLETNGDLVSIEREDFLNLFEYICISPKAKPILDRVMKYLRCNELKCLADVKVVTDLETIGMDMLEHATLLMPLTTHDSEKDSEIRKRVWNYCVENHIGYSARLHVEVWGQERQK